MQANRNFAQPRGGGRHAQNHAYAQQQSQQQNRALIEQQRAKERLDKERRERNSRRPADRDIPSDIAKITIGDGVERYKQLRNVERKLDATIMQKRLDLTDSFRQTSEVEGTLRLWISNTAEGQPWQIVEEGGSGIGEDGTFDFADNSQATYRVKIESRLLEDETKEKDDDAMDEDSQAQSKKLETPRARFSDYFRAIRIEFDRSPSLQSDGLNTIEWRRPLNPEDPKKPRLANGSPSSFDTLEFQRKGDEEINITINLYVDHQPPRYKFSKPLAELLDAEEGDVLSVIAGIWDYVRANNLQEDDEHRRFVCDARLRKIFNMDALVFPQLREILLNQSHLSDLPPLKLPYTIRLDKPYISPSDDPAAASAPTIYDVRVPLPSPLDAQLRRITASPTHLQSLKQIQDMDGDIATLIQAVKQGALKHAFLTSLSEDPVRFVRRWVASQKRDLDVVLAEGGRGFGEDPSGGGLDPAMRKGGIGGVWGSQGVREAAGVWLAKNRAH